MGAYLVREIWSLFTDLDQLLPAMTEYTSEKRDEYIVTISNSINSFCRVDLTVDEFKVNCDELYNLYLQYLSQTCDLIVQQLRFHSIDEQREMIEKIVKHQKKLCDLSYVLPNYLYHDIKEIDQILDIFAQRYCPHKMVRDQLTFQIDKIPKECCYCGYHN